MRKSAPLLACAALLAGLISACGPKPTVIKDGPVQISVHPVNLSVRYVDHVYFPQGKGCGRAYTYWSYDCKTEFKMKPRPDLNNDGKTNFEIEAIKMDVSLDLVESLPFFVSQKLRDHEEGHVTMCKMLYRNAGEIAKRSAQKIIGATITVVPGPLSQSSSLRGSAENEAHLAVCKEYRANTSDIADAVAITYDRLTSHGLNTVKEADASKQAFLQYFNAGNQVPPGDEDLAK